MTETFLLLPCSVMRQVGYAGNVWFLQPPPSDHPWRSMPWHGMTPHTSGTALSAQTRYAEGSALRDVDLFRAAPDPTTGYPLNYVRDGIPCITRYADGSSTPCPETIDYPWSTVRVRLRRVGFAQIPCRARLSLVVSEVFVVDRDSLMRTTSSPSPFSQRAYPQSGWQKRRT